MAEIPRLSYDLIDLLDRTTDQPHLPRTGLEFSTFSEAVVRQTAYAAGFRACVDMLVEMRAADEAEANAKSNPVEPEQDDPFLTVYGPDGKPHTGVASTHMAGRLATDGHDDGSEP